VTPRLVGMRSADMRRTEMPPATAATHACAHSTTTPGRRCEASAEPIPGYLRPALRRARLVTLASARAARSSARYTRTASGWDSFQTSGRSE
jgi:hypothetical protein